MIALVIAIAGGIGAATRFWVDGEIRSRWATRLPVATITINVIGSFILGMLVGRHDVTGGTALWFPMLGTGFCGGFTTFSTAMVETVRLSRSSYHRQAIINVLGTTVACVGVAALGVLLGGAIGA